MRYRTLFLAMLAAVLAGMAWGQENVPSLNEGEVYVAFNSDHECKTRSRGVEFDFEAIYIVSAELLLNELPEDQVLENAIRISPLGGCRHPAWNKRGDRLAYLEFSSGFQTSKVVIVDFQNKERRVVGTSPPTSQGISWSAAGDKLVYGGCEVGICIYDLVSETETVVFKNPKCESVSCSPDGKWIAFKTRDGQGANDADGWRLNLLDVISGKHHVVGEIDDRFGVLGPFLWTKDSQRIAVNRFQLDEEGRRQYSNSVFDLSESKFLSTDEWPKDLQAQDVRFWDSPIKDNK